MVPSTALDGSTSQGERLNLKYSTEFDLAY